LITDGIPSSEVGKTGHLDWGRRVTPDEERENHFERQSNMEKPAKPLSFDPAIANQAIGEWYSRMQSRGFFDGLGLHLDFEGFITHFGSLSDLVGKSDKQVCAEYINYLKDHKTAEGIVNNLMQRLLMGSSGSVVPMEIAQKIALSQLINGASTKGFLTMSDAQTLVNWALEIGTKGMIHDPHDPPNDFIHAHIGQADHIPIR
jgi:hypothetical protein